LLALRYHTKLYGLNDEPREVCLFPLPHDPLVKHVCVYLDTEEKGARVDLEVRASVSFRTVEPLPGITTRESSNEERE
jgi:hypothetical protein